jgi:hypothetical protein
MDKNKINTWFFLLISFLISAAGWGDLFHTCIANNFLHTSLKWQVLLCLLGVFVLLQLFLVFLLANKGTEKKIMDWIRKVRSIQLPPLLAGFVLLCLGFSYGLLVYSSYGNFFEGLFFRLLILWIIAVIGALCIGERYQMSFIIRFIFLFLLTSLGYVLISYRKEISTSPFTLSWSEASRYYYASLFAAPRLYGERLAWPFLHPSRYVLQSIPFLIGDFPIVAHRIWQVFLWISMPLLTIWIFLRRIVSSNGIKSWIFLVWSFLFLYQGPVYYHLLVCVWLVFLGYNKNKLWKTTLFMVLASLWAGISRVNWFPVPAMITIVLYLLDHPYPGKKKFISYFTAPVVFTAAGLVSAFSAQLLYAFFSGEQHLESFGSSFTSDLLWYRLLPNSTSQWGIVLPILLLTLPVMIFIGVNLSRSSYHFWQLLPIGAIALVLFGGGLVVSTKIGGGGNLHNLDSWLVLLWLLAGKLFYTGNKPIETTALNRWLPAWLLLLVMVLPAVYHIDLFRPYQKITPDKISYPAEREELDSIIKHAAEISRKGEEVLFISQRQLLMFDTHDIPVVSDYELLTLMEMAISTNQPYLEKFRADLQAHRFGMIVVEKQVPKLSNQEDAYFSEENNAWVENITFPLLDSYVETRSYPVSGITILLPKE